MQIQVNTDNHVDATAAFNQFVEDFLGDKLRRFATRLTRVEVHFTDESSAAKSSNDDKRCLIEARITGQQPVSASDRGASVDEALRGATRKVQALLDSKLGKLEDRRGEGAS